jgi:Na+-driven multidrug efflux pump
LTVGLVELFALRIPIPLGLLLAGAGAASVWYGMTAAIVGGALFGGAWFLTGSWRAGGPDRPGGEGPSPTD